MTLCVKLKPSCFTYALFTAFFLSFPISFPIFGEDSGTTIGDLNARIDDLERQISEGAAKTDDVNPGKQVTADDLERLKEEIRALKDSRQGGSDEVNHLQEEINSLREDMKQLKSENTELRAQKSSKKAMPAAPAGVSKEITPEVDDETESVLKLLEKSAPGGATQEDEQDSSTKKQKKDVNTEAIREMATKHAEETAPSLPTGSAEAQYNEAFALYDKGAYKEAERAFEYFIKAYPNDPLIPKAMYWKGESCMQQGKLKEAKILFVNAYKKNPKGPKAADCLLKLGETLAIQDKKDDACTAWRKLKADFPHMTSEMKSSLTTLKKKYGCE